MAEALKPFSYSQLLMQGLGAGLFLLSFITGIFFNGTDSFLFMPCIGGLIGLCVLMLWPGIGREFSVPRSWLLIFVLLYLSLVWANIFWSLVPYNSILFAFIFSIFPVLFLVFSMAPERQNWLVVLGSVIAAGVAALSVWALVQFFFLFDTYGPRIHHPMLNPNNLAVIFNMCLFPAFALYAQQKSLVRVVLCFVLIVLYMAALLVTQSRGAFLSLLIAAVPFFVFTWKHQGIQWRRVLPVLLCGVLLFGVVNHGNSGKLGKSITTLPQDKRSVVERQLIWGSTWEIIQQDIWLGKGLGTFVYYYPRYRSPLDRSDGYFVHMDPLQFWVEGGVFLPLLFYSILVTVLVLSIKATRHSEPGSSERLWLWACLCGLMVLALHSHISFHLYMPAPLIMAAVLMGIWFAYTQRTLKLEIMPLRVPSGWQRGLARGGLVVIAALPMLWLISAAVGVYYAQKIPALINDAAYDDARREIDLLERWSPSNWQKPYDFELQYRIALLQDRNRVSDPVQRAKLFEEALGFAAKSRSLNPAFTNLWNREAWLHYLSWPDLDAQGREKAVVLLQEALEANPLLVTARVGLARIYETMGQDAQAEAVLEQGMRYPMPIGPSALDVYRDLARLKMKAGKKAEAITVLNEAQKAADRIAARANKK